MSGCFRCGHPEDKHVDPDVKIFGGRCITPDCKCPGFYSQADGEADAVFSAEHHVVKGTMLSDAAVLNCCKVILAWQKHRVALRKAITGHPISSTANDLATDVQQILNGERE